MACVGREGGQLGYMRFVFFVFEAPSVFCGADMVRCRRSKYSVKHRRRWYND